MVPGARPPARPRPPRCCAGGRAPTGACRGRRACGTDPGRRRRGRPRSRRSSGTVICLAGAPFMSASSVDLGDVRTLLGGHRYDNGVSAATRRAQGRASTDEGFSATVAAITSAFGDGTRRQIYLFARERHGVTATEVAEQFALHPNVARHHLDKLAAGGYLDVYVDHGSAGVGRPSKRYLLRHRRHLGRGAGAARRPSPRAARPPADDRRPRPGRADRPRGRGRLRPLARLADGAGRCPEVPALGHAVRGRSPDRSGICRSRRRCRVARTPSSGTTAPSATPPSITRCCAQPTGVSSRAS